MIPVLIAALVAAASPQDTVYTVDGGRITGSVMEESPTAGVTIQMPDGSVRRIERAQVSRIEYADGTVSPPRPPPRPPEPAAPVGPRKAPEGPQDTVFFTGGGRVRGTVIEENPRSGVRVRQLDGTYQTYPRDDVARIVYADGTVSQVAPAPEAAPAPSEPPRLVPFYLTLGLGGTFLGGDATKQVAMSDLFTLQQIHVSGEAGLRLSPGWALGVYGDAGGGEPSLSERNQCALAGYECGASVGRIGFLVRHTWEPFSNHPIWLSLGTGLEYGSITVRRYHDGGTGKDTGGEDLITYVGWEHLRVGTGIDFKLNRILGFGLYGSVGFGTYDHVKNQVATVNVERAIHTTALVGGRLVLFP
jgi:hypothetical protein